MERRLICATEVTQRPIHWVWLGRIPARAITILEGDPNHGKSTIIYDLAARISSGRPMPDCPEGVPPAGAVLLMAEDSLPSTAVPNLQTAGADLPRVKLFDKHRFREQPFVLPADLPLIEEAVLEVGAKFVVIDPLTAFLPTAANADVATRRFLAPLEALAERQDLAVLLVRHLRKAPAAKSLHCGAGSIAIIAAARSALLVDHDPSSDDRHHHVLTPNKSNLSDAPSLAYRTVQHQDQSITVEWLGPSEYSAPDIAAARAEADQHTALREAMYVLYSILTEGGVPANEVIRVAKAAGTSERTLKRAKHRLHVESKKKGSGRDSQWFWYLPANEELYRPLRDKELGELMDRLIFGDDDVAPLRGKRKEGGNTSREDKDRPGDDGDGLRPVP